MKGSLWQVAVLFLVIALALPALDIALADAADEVAATDGATIDYDAVTTVDADGFSYNETITVTTDSGTELDAGTDYEWDAATGNVTWLNSSATADGESVTIAYATLQHDEATETSNDALWAFAPAFLGLILLVSIGTLWAWFDEAGGGF